MKECPLCKSKKNELLYTNSRGDKYLENYVCDNCGFIYTYPRISNEEVNRLYLDGEFSKEARKSSEPDLNKFIQTETRALERLHLLEQKLPGFFSFPKTCLEIGCGTGSFLWLLKSRGHKVKGIEPDSIFVSNAAKKYNIDLETLLFDDFNDSQTFDFICNFHVIEHVLDPRSFVKKMYEKLNTNGSVYIECPTIDDIYTNDLNTFFWDVHVNTFSNRSLPWLLESEGFSIDEVFMNRGYVGVIARKGSNKKFEPESKERIVKIIQDFKFLKPVVNQERSFKVNILKTLKKSIPKRIKKSIKALIKSQNKEVGSKKNDIPQIINHPENKPKHELFHVSAFNYGNAGDTLLPVVLQDTWKLQDNQFSWVNQSVYPKVDLELVKKINKAKGLVIGGGGLFLRDTNANDLSGWQWPCSIEMLNKINVPIVMYAVGYNRFRGQEEFEPYFKENITAFAEKAEYLGIRNTGSIEALKNYIPKNLHHKLRFQPCMTTFISELYPNITDYNEKQDFVAVNAAFDRSHLRYGEKIGDILAATAKVLKEVSKQLPIKFYIHSENPPDHAILPFLQSFGVKYEVVKFNHMHPEKVIQEYAKPKLVIGMRGHAQMIPFGCKTPIRSIVTHNKLQYFLDDLGKPEWGADVLSKTYEQDLRTTVFNALENTQEEIAFISKKQKELYGVATENVKDALKAMDLK